MAEAWDLKDFLLVDKVKVSSIGNFDGIRVTGSTISFKMKFAILRSDKKEGLECKYEKEYSFNSGLEKALGKQNFKALPAAVKRIFTTAMEKSFSGKLKELENTFERTDIAIRKRIKDEFERSTTEPKTIDPTILVTLNKFRKSAFDDYANIFRKEMNKRMEALFYWSVRQVLARLAPKNKKLQNVPDRDLILKTVGLGLIVTVVVLSILLLTVAAPPVGAAVGLAGAAAGAATVMTGVGYAFTALNSTSALQSLAKTVNAFSTRNLSYWKTADQELTKAHDALAKAAASLQLLGTERQSLTKELKQVQKTFETDDKALKEAEKKLKDDLDDKKRKKVEKEIAAFRQACDITDERMLHLVALLEDSDLEDFVEKLVSVSRLIDGYTNKDAKRIEVKAASGLNSLLDDTLGKFFDSAAAVGRAAEIVKNTA